MWLTCRILHLSSWWQRTPCSVLTEWGPLHTIWGGWGHVAPGRYREGARAPAMGETAEYQRLQETSESDYQRLPSDDEEVDIYTFFDYSSGHAAELDTHWTEIPAGFIVHAKGKQRSILVRKFSAIKASNNTYLLLSKIGIAFRGSNSFFFCANIVVVYHLCFRVPSFAPLSPEKGFSWHFSGCADSASRFKGLTTLRVIVNVNSNTFTIIKFTLWRPHILI